jgi:hypothetical protein
MQIHFKRQFWGRVAFFSAIMALQIYVIYLWIHTPPAKAENLQPLVVELDNYDKTRGQYPTSCVSLASFTHLSKNFTIYTGEPEANGIAWNPFEVSSHDFTILTTTNSYEIFLPAEHIKLISFSSFPVWHLDSDEHRWQKGRIHWSLIGSYWSKN